MIPFEVNTRIVIIGFYAQNAPPLEYTPQNILCGLNTVGYSVKPKVSSSEALVAISINKKPEEIRLLFYSHIQKELSVYRFTKNFIFRRNQQLQFESSLSSILGNRPNITVHVDRVTSVPDSKSLALIYVQERQPNSKFCILRNVTRVMIISEYPIKICIQVPTGEYRIVKFVHIYYNLCRSNNWSIWVSIMCTHSPVCQRAS